MQLCMFYFFKNIFVVFEIYTDEITKIFHIQLWYLFSFFIYCEIFIIFYIYNIDVHYYIFHVILEGISRIRNKCI